MAFEKENFDLNGPKYLTQIDWNNPRHRESITASLVKGVYTLESDRSQNRQGQQALAPDWWNSFNFELTQVLEDKQGKKYGAIFKSNIHNHTGQGPPPKCVIAFRGTVNRPGNVARDYKQNLQIFLNNLERSPRFRAGMEAAENTVKENGPENVWLAGHSAGSSIALLIGRKMVEKEKEMENGLETYLFNPPFLSFPIEQVKSENLKDVLRVGKSFLTAGLVFVAKPHDNDRFIMLSTSTWKPHLFVNKSNPICSNYVGYFEHREKMERMGFRKIGNIATRHSMRSIFYRAIGKDSEPIHLLPSAHLAINTSPTINVGNCEISEAHGIHQWWKPDLQVYRKRYEHN